MEKMKKPDLCPVVPLPLDDKTLRDLTEKAKDFALMHGVCMKVKSKYDRDSLHFAPFVLFPSPFPRQEFLRALELQPLLNEMIHKVAYNYEFMASALRKTILVDEFTRKLFEIYETVRQEGVVQEISLALIRSDYFYISDKSIKQIEINTIASSFGSIASHLFKAHKYVLSEIGFNEEQLKNLPFNNALEGLTNGLLEGWNLYNSPDAFILFIVEDVTYNICDQRFMEYEIRKKNPQVFVLRKTLTEVYQDGYLTKDKKLMIDDHEIGVIYFRSGYSPEQYPSDKEWEARLLMERSLAIKSPSIQYHLAGTKKIQQELSNPENLSMILDGNMDKISKIQSIFTGLYTLDKTQEGDANLENALRTPEKYVLKPQREGGGNNIYGEDIKDFLISIQDSNEREAYILMDKIKPPMTLNYFIRPGFKDPSFCECVSELGIFGYILGDSKTILSNKTSGHMLRTKFSHVNEGGVAVGLAVTDSPYLVDLQGVINEAINV